MLASARKIVEVLQKKGYVAYFAGGCVRDMLLDVPPKDIDIVTSALPDEIEKIFTKTVAIGKQFGVIQVHHRAHMYEVASFRMDGLYEDGRRPVSVSFSSAEEDAKRRDFTINGMFYDPVSKKLIDFVGGEKDLKERLVHFIGDSEERIREDHLRILRAVRMVHQIGGQYHPDTYAALRKYSHLVKKVSAERLRDELTKILLLPDRAEAMEDLFEIGVLSEILPELVTLKGVAQPRHYHHEGSVWDHAMRSIGKVGKVASSRLQVAGRGSLPDSRLKTLEANRGQKVHDRGLFLWTVLLHDIGKPDTFSVVERVRFDGHAERGSLIAAKILKRLAFSAEDIKRVSWLIKYHMSTLFILKMPKDKKIKWITHPYFHDLLELLRADCMGTVPTGLTLYRRLKKMAKELIAKLPKQIPRLITGEEIMEITGLSSGREVGKILEKIERLQLKGKIRTKHQAEKVVRKIVES